MYKNILVAVDDSATSRRALNEAIALSKLHSARLEIVHAVDESMVDTLATHGGALTNVDQFDRALLDNGKSVLATAVATARAAGLEPAEHLLTSHDLHAADQISKAVTSAKADLLVVGSHGRRGFRRLLLGSVAEDLMRKVEISVLVVRGHLPEDTSDD
ncbi:MAG: universal stress protein [Zoogloeaceae bacterium]|nr:universal stress protein [Zoogloeaceae bacterium]